MIFFFEFLWMVVKLIISIMSAKKILTNRMKNSISSSFNYIFFTLQAAPWYPGKSSPWPSWICRLSFLAWCSGWKKAACPYKLAGVAHLSMPKAMCESGIRGGGKTWGGKWVKGVLWGAKYHLAYFVVLLPLFLGLKWTGVCAFRAEK